MDQSIASKWFTLARHMVAELEKYMASPYTINVVEEIARNKMTTMIHEKREEDRKRLFEETAQVSRLSVCCLRRLLLLVEVVLLSFSSSGRSVDRLGLALFYWCMVRVRLCVRVMMALEMFVFW